MYANGQKQNKITVLVILLVASALVMAVMPMAIGAGKSLGYGNPEGVVAQAELSKAQAVLIQAQAEQARAQSENYQGLSVLFQSLPGAGSAMVNVAIAIVAICLGIGVLVVLFSLAYSIITHAKIKYAQNAQPIEEEEEYIPAAPIADKPDLGDRLSDVFNRHSAPGNGGNSNASNINTTGGSHGNTGIFRSNGL